MSSARRITMPAENPRRQGGGRQDRASGASGGRKAGQPAASRGLRQGAGRQAGARTGAPRTGASRSVRVGDLGVQQRGRGGRGARTPHDPQKRTWAGRFVVAIVIVAVLVVAGFAVYHSNLLPVREVTVTGVEHLTPEEMASLAAVPVGATLINVDTAGIEARLEGNAWVEDARVRRVLPDTLELMVTERTIAAVVTITSTADQQDEDWAIASDGMWLLRVPGRASEEAAAISQQVFVDAEQVLRITDVPYGVEPEAGAYCADESVVNALNIVAQMSDELAGRVTTVSATDTANTLITLDNGVQIAFGAAEDVRDKERVVLALLAEHPDEIAYINVRVADRPTWRSL